MARDRNEDRVFKTENGEKEWKYRGPKQGGANGAGEHGGFYESDSTSGTQRCLIKQDVRIPLNIAEFLAGKIYQATTPDVSATIKLVRVNDDIEISPDGRNVYLLSEFIPNWRHDLYTEIQLSLNRSTEHSTYKYKETMEVAGQLVFYPREVSTFFQQQTAQGHLTNFGQVSAISLLINNTDTNLGNLGVIERDGKKMIGVIDYGAAFRNMTPKINPHSLRKYLATHMRNQEGWNNFIFYPESIKITSEFVNELDKASVTNLSPVVDEAFEEITAYYGIKPIVEFAVRAGLYETCSDSLLEELQQNPVLAAQKVELIKTRLIDALQKRQADLSRFSAQIKMDMCVKIDGATKQCNLNGDFSDQDERKIRFNDVVFSHFDYFKETLLGDEKFKFRKAAHKRQASLVEEVNTKCHKIFASFLLIHQNRDLQDEYQLHTMEAAILALKNGVFPKETLKRVLNKDYIEDAKTILATYEAECRQRKLASVIDIINGAAITLNEAAAARLEQNVKLQDAILNLDRRIDQLGKTYTTDEKEALFLYKKETIQLALEGEASFKRGYRAVEEKAIKAIDHNDFIKVARTVGNLIVLALATVSLLGALGLYLTSSQRGGILLFSSPKREITNIAASFDDIDTPEFKP